MPKFKSSVTGKFVSQEFAKANPDTTFKKAPKKKASGMAAAGKKVRKRAC